MKPIMAYKFSNNKGGTIVMVTIQSLINATIELLFKGLYVMVKCIYLKLTIFICDFLYLSDVQYLWFDSFYGFLINAIPPYPL